MAGETEEKEEDELNKKLRYSKYRTGEAELKYKKKKPEDEEEKEERQLF